MTQITRRLAPGRGLVFLLAMILGAGLVLSGCGDDDTATTPAPAPAPPPPPAPEPEPEPEPEAPATPTGLHVSATTMTTITWSWDAVEGAMGYGIQASMDEVWDETDQIVAPILETSWTSPDLPPSTTLYVRVASGILVGADFLSSDWSTHVSGMTAMPPPEPEPEPDPVSVSFMVPEDAEDAHPLIPDEGDDEDTAMASVNSEIMVTSNTSAIVEPMWIENAAAVAVMAGDSSPFGLVDWMAKQSMVVNEGVTFKVTRTMVGANQEMMPTGDVAYVTCGPFECAGRHGCPGDLDLQLLGMPRLGPDAGTCGRCR